LDSAKGNNAHVLVVDDDPLMRFSLRELLSQEGYSVKDSPDGETAIAMLERDPFDVILSDVSMPGIDGFELLKQAKHAYPDTQVILMTAFGKIGDAVSGMRLGAYDYVTKPLDDEQVKLSIAQALAQRNSLAGDIELEKKPAKKFHFEDLVTSDHRMERIFDLISVIADTEATILISGSSGTGKTAIARAVHHHSGRKDKPLVEISCGALSENLLESELFGHVKGAFTSAMTDKMGKIEKAADGTIFLDEIDTLGLRLQVKLLRFLQDRKFEKVGSTETIQSNARVIAAANRDLAKLVAEGEFREDLFYRLNVVAIELPPLKDHVGDVPLLVDHFIQKYNTINARNVQSVDDEVMKRFLSYGWPGNIRELENTIERAVILCTNECVTFDLLPDYLRDVEGRVSSEGLLPLQKAIDIAEKRAISRALSHFKGNRNKTAEFLEVNRTTLYQKMKKSGLLDKDFKNQ
jgi:DNA-binding NtrC family response regulator